jgi:uncharacterized protein
MTHDIEIHESAKLEGATVLLGFPGVGFSSPIAANYLVKKMDMEHVGHVVSGDFPPVASVHEYRPQHPMRIYQKGSLVVVMLEFAPQGDLVRPLGLHLLKWTLNEGAKRIVILDTLSPTNLEALMEDNRSIYSVGTTEAERAALETAGIDQVEEGMITGLAGVLLAEGASIGVPVMSIMSEAHPMFPDVRAAVQLLEAGAKVAREMEVDLAELEENAAEVEKTVQEQLAQAQKLMEAQMGAQGAQGMPTTPTAPQYMYG